MPLKNDMLRKYLSPCFIETGTYLGDGVQSALDAGFAKVVSIELSFGQFFERAVNRFKNDSRVLIVQGDSADILFDVIKGIDTQMTFWLDGHWSGGDTAYGKFNSPLLSEIEQIGKHSIKNHIIIVDDMRCWITGNPDTPDITFTEEDIQAKILTVNNYQFAYEDGYIPNDILIAQIK